MDDQPHRNEGFSGPSREQKLAERRESDWLDDLARQRVEHASSEERPALTRREREERWPIG